MHELVGRVNCKQESNLLFRHKCNTVVVPRLMQLRILAKNHYDYLGYQGGELSQSYFKIRAYIQKCSY